MVAETAAEEENPVTGDSAPPITAVGTEMTTEYPQAFPWSGVSSKNSLEDRLAYYKAKYGEDFQADGIAVQTEKGSGKSGPSKRKKGSRPSGSGNRNRQNNRGGKGAQGGQRKGGQGAQSGNKRPQQSGKTGGCQVSGSQGSASGSSQKEGIPGQTFSAGSKEIFLPEQAIEACSGLMMKGPLARSFYCYKSTGL